ncbi:MAG: hypothetical protein QM802_11610 [Agriterribacter sp.]
MRRVLELNNHDVLREIKCIRESLSKASYATELQGYFEWVLSFLNEKEKAIKDNLYYLSLNVDPILSEVLERSQSVTLNIRVLSAKYISPLSRYSKSDNLSVMLLKWLHDQHPQSKGIPFAVSDGNFSIYPSTQIPVLYYLPSSSQRSILHLPLFFHEFGHYLFEYHRREMVDLIISMQDKMEELLIQPFQQNDSKFQRDRAKAKSIIEAWYDWIEELFCDLVGLTIGGPAFLRTFSLYLRMSGREAFYLNDKELERTTHPVSRIRIKFLVERAKIMGFVNEAMMIESEWQQMASLMKVSQVYHGYYSNSYDSIINETLDNMLEEACPIRFVDFVVSESSYVFGESNYIQLVDEAWKQHEKNYEKYDDWEIEIVDKFRDFSSNNPHVSHSPNLD